MSIRLFCYLWESFSQSFSPSRRRKKNTYFTLIHFSITTLQICFPKMYSNLSIPSDNHGKLEDKKAKSSNIVVVLILFCNLSLYVLSFRLFFYKGSHIERSFGKIQKPSILSSLLRKPFHFHRTITVYVHIERRAKRFSLREINSPGGR